MKEAYFNISYEFNRDEVDAAISKMVELRESAYICVADGNILTMVHNDTSYRETVAGAEFSICDSGWVPLYLKRIYGIERQQYCGAQIFRDIVSARKYKMAFLGTDDETLADLRVAISEWNPDVVNMHFASLPFCAVDEFDYQSIARSLEEQGAQVIWVALGAPKQEQFMQRLKPYLKQGVMIGVGAVFNFYSGRVKRAPKWLRALHLEFAWRIMTEPRKQLRRCYSILKSLPGIYAAERKRAVHVIPRK